MRRQGSLAKKIEPLGLYFVEMEPPVGYDPTTSRWQREVLPLNYGGDIWCPVMESNHLHSALKQTLYQLS